VEALENAFGQDLFQAALALELSTDIEQLKRVNPWLEMVNRKSEDGHSLQEIHTTLLIIPQDDRVLLCRALIDKNYIHQCYKKVREQV
jgi:hypothetical protein